MKPVIIFDFDGTIADTFPVVLDAFHHVTKRQVPLNKDETHLFRGVVLGQVKGRAILRHAAAIHVPFWHIPFVYLLCRALLKRRMKEVRPMPGVHHVIQQLHEAGYPLYVMSANRRKNIETFLKHEHLHAYVSAIYGDIRGGKKTAALARLVKGGSITPHHTWAIGDEDRDITAAAANGIKTIAVTWGYNTREQLQASQPTHMVSDADDILKIIQGKYSEEVANRIV